MPITTNERYKAFLERQMVQPIDKAAFTQLLGHIEHPHPNEARALCILLWTTGARPNEALRLCGGDIQKTGLSLWVKLPGSKGSLARTIELPTKNEMVRELWNHAKMFFPGLHIFPHFISQKRRATIQKTKKGGRNKKTYSGPEGRGYVIYESNLGYWFKKWFQLPPYIFRHNRLTIAAEKLTINQLKLLKGAKTEASVWPYVNLTKKEAKKIGRELIK